MNTIPFRGAALVLSFGGGRARLGCKWSFPLQVKAGAPSRHDARHAEA